MKKLFPLAVLLAFLFSCESSGPGKSDELVLEVLEQYIDVQDFFKLKSNFEMNKNALSEIHVLYYGSIISNVFNMAEESNADIELLLSKHKASLNDTMLNTLYLTKLLNHINLYEYRAAADASDLIQNSFLALNDSSEVEALQNEIKIWRALEDVPVQEIIKTMDVTIPMVKDKVGLFNVDVSFGEITKNLLFDTGANFSVMVRSLAQELGLKIIEADFYVTAATGKRVKSDIAIAEELFLNGIIFKNVFFLVLDDEDLSFPQIDYYINGAIGFPVIEAMEEIRVSKENQIFVPQYPVAYSYNNFALNGLMPILAAIYKGDTLLFNFDTGATNTSLYPQFYSDYKSEIESTHEKEKFKASSGGGTVEFEGYKITGLELNVADSRATIDTLQLHIDNIGSDDSKFHGNFGQDYIKQFDEMIISFEYASVLFK